MEIRALREDVSDRRAAIGDLLEVVEDEQQFSLTDVAGEVVAGAEGAADLLEHELRIVEWRELDPEDTRAELRHELGRGLDGEAGLARAARSCEREQSRSAADPVDDGRSVAGTTHEGAGGSGQVRVRDRLQRRGAARFPGAEGRIPNFTGAEAAARLLASLKEWQAADVLKSNPVDLVVCGTVAVNRRCVRVGKGGGYSDLEFALLSESGAIDDRTVVVTTVHPVQMLDENLPETKHDFRVDVIVTPDEVIRCRRAHRPRGIVSSHLDRDTAAAIPVLAGRV